MRTFFGPLWNQIIDQDEIEVNSSTVYAYQAFVPIKIKEVFESPNGKYANSISSGVILEYKGNTLL